MKSKIKSFLKKIRSRWHNDVLTKIESLQLPPLSWYNDVLIKINNLIPPSSPQDGFVHVSIGVVNWGSKFKKFTLSNNMPEKIALLKNGLDEESKNTIDLFLDRMLYLPDGDLKKFYKLSKSYLDSLYTDKERIFDIKYWGELPQYKTDFYLGTDEYSPDTFLFHHGLRFVSEKVKKYIKDKDFIDGGAWIGDSALVLNKYYSPGKIFSFELSLKNCELFQFTMDSNNISKDKYCLVPMGLGDKNEKILIDDVGGQGASILRKGSTDVIITTMDSFVKENRLNVGFIKADLEGHGLKALKGMINTIRTYRPVLSLAIYHNTDEFFEMKPFLEEIVKDKNYKMMIKRFHVCVDNTSEICLFAYPAELDEGELYENNNN